MSEQDIIRKRIQVYGSVLMELQGTEEQIDKVFETVVQSRWINVTDMKVQKIEVEESRGFHTR